MATLIPEGDDDEASMVSCLRSAAGLLRTRTASEVLEGILGPQPRLQRMIVDIDHVGFLATPLSLEVLEWAAADAGFDGPSSLIESKVVARELGTMSGRDSVPTRIFQSWGDFNGGAPRGIEVFMPAADRTSVLGWVRAGLWPHVAFRIAESANFDAILDLARAEGLRLPHDMSRGPRTNGAVTLLYVEPPVSGPHLRAEFCHYAPNAT
jgi:hypothetical protein